MVHCSGCKRSGRLAGTSEVVSAFEVEKSTSIYSGILRLTDLALSADSSLHALYLVIPDDREREVLFQLRRPAVKNQGVDIKYILFSELQKYCDAVCRLGADHTIMEKLARQAHRRRCHGTSPTSSS